MQITQVRAQVPEDVEEHLEVEEEEHGSENDSWGEEMM